MPLFDDHLVGTTQISAQTSAQTSVQTSPQTSVQIDEERDMATVDVDRLSRLESVYRSEYSGLVRLAYTFTTPTSHGGI